MNAIYSYKIELNELQVLLGRMKDNWKFAHLKGTSSLHVLDRFNISLQVRILRQMISYVSTPHLITFVKKKKIGRTKNHPYDRSTIPSFDDIR